MTTEEKLQELNMLFTRGVGEFVDPDNSFRKKIEAKIKGENNKDIIIKFGVDPTRPDIHLGHAVVFRKLRKLQDLGCKAIFLVGDYTSQIGDPTGKNKVRPELEQKEIEANMKTYLDQVGKILSTTPETFSWIRNSDWFTSVTDIQTTPGLKVNLTGNGMTGVFEGNSFIGKAILFNKTRMQETHLHHKEIHSLSFSYILRTLRKITHSRLIERDMFQNRIKNGEELYMHEMLYPVLQGLDSHILAKIYGSCDLEIGGSDQHFNMLMGRHVMKIYNQEEQAVISFQLLEGIDGKEKMSKSLDNYIAITDSPTDMYGKIMSIPDTLIIRYFELCTFIPSEIIEKKKGLLFSSEANPRDMKMELAKQIVAIYHGEGEAQKAEESFVHTFQKKEIPENIEEIIIPRETKFVDIVVEKGVVESKGNARRLIEQGAITHLETGTKIIDADHIVSSGTYKIGKKEFIKFTVK